MPVQIKQEKSQAEVLPKGGYFFAQREFGGAVLFCQMTKADRAWVVNGHYEVSVDRAKMEIHIPYSNIFLKIKHVGRPAIEDVRDYNAAIDWFENMVCLTNQKM